MKELIKDAIESAWADGRDINDASDIPADLRPAIVKAWRETASPIDINEAYLAGDDDFDMATLLAFALDEALTHEGQRAMLNCFWWGIAWRVDKLIEEVKAESPRAVALARKEMAGNWDDWQRDRFADAKEYQA